MTVEEADKEQTSGATAAEQGPLTYHDLAKLTVGRLRELAKEFDDLQGVIGMSKEQLIYTLARKKGIEIPHRVVVGIDKAAIKSRIRVLKDIRDSALETRDREQLRRARRKLHRLRHQLRKSSTVTS